MKKSNLSKGEKVVVVVGVALIMGFLALLTVPSLLKIRATNPDEPLSQIKSPEPE